MKTHIRSDLLQRAFRRALFLGIPGGILLAMGWLFPLPLALIAWGMVPYRRLSRLRSQPNLLIWEGDTLLYISRGKVRRALVQVRSINYEERAHRYGVNVETETGNLFFPYFKLEPRLQDVMHPDESDEMV